MTTARRLLLGLACCLGVSATAQTLRWASQGDIQTLDPHSQNELLTNSLNGQVYEYLLRRMPDQSLGPSLATEWTRLSPTVWRLKLRASVKFHDGTPFTAEDVAFSMQRLRDANSPFRVYAFAVGAARALDPLTIEFVQDKPDPIFLEHLLNLHIMSKRWCEQHRITRPLNFKAKEESHASQNMNGTGPFMLVSRQPGTKTVYKRNPAWWNRHEGNVQDFVYLPIGNDATRLAALISGEIDLVLDPAPRDVARLRSLPGIKVLDGPENRLIFVGMDQGRDKLLYAKVPGDANPFKDQRMRRAMYQAIDIEAIRTKLMNGLSLPTGGVTVSPLGSFNDPQLESRLPYDLAAARKLMQEAGYADGFEVTMDCPNNRYINDEEICIALATMWAQLKLKVRVNAQPRALVFPKLEKLDTSLYLYGWGGGTTDAEIMFGPVLRNRGADGIGYANYGQWINERGDELAAASALEASPEKRQALIKAALQAYREAVTIIPLHRQVIPWAMRSGVSAVHSPANWLSVDWVTVQK
ncbi:ABC transporter substrate-binding protein [Roseateles violae]|uniref:ABC transporter substrate-binding protein n=1 Tax=Roseateles violae TaxID=3058042 RepID=A0ABT8DX53_9BURK|nr:ABC transporter substrate-binding protein [Pelomonas sp. PFR6]MDN3921868.1 ABC transporter substrate-binding protein [Pelomonas sp. PFR6]